MTKWQRSFADLPTLDSIGAQVVAAAVADEGARRGSRLRIHTPLRPLVLAVVLLVAVAATAAAGTLVVLRGSVIPAPAPIDVPDEQTPVPGSAKLAETRAADPAGGTPWTMRVAESRTGFVCSTVGQVVDGQFGLVGLDGKFRRLAVGIVDGCGHPRDNAATLIGARVFDADRLADVRTVVNGIGGRELRKVTVEARGRPHQIPVEDGGVFVAAFRGYPEDLGVRVSLRFADGHVENHPFGASQFVTPDPVGGRAWTLEVGGIGRPTSASCQDAMRRGKPCPPDMRPVKNCVRFHPAREGLNQPWSTQVCGYTTLKRVRSRGLRQFGYFFGVRREGPGPATGRGPSWGNHPPRTSVYGFAGMDVARIEVDGPGGTRQATIDQRRAFLLLYGPKVKPEQLTVRVFKTDGKVETYRGDTNTVAPPGGPR